MLRGLLRLLVRLFFFGLIVGAVGFVVTRLLGGEDEDFEDFDDLESSFEFNETPVEIEVSASSDAPGSVASTGSEAPGSDADVETDNSYPTMGKGTDTGDLTGTDADDASDTIESEATESDAAEDASTESASTESAEDSTDDTSTSAGEGRQAALNTTVFTDLPETEGPRLIDIKGIGPSYESRLHSIGIQTMQDLINADPNRIAEELDVIGGPGQVEEWVKQAHTMLEEHQG